MHTKQKPAHNTATNQQVTKVTLLGPVWLRPSQDALVLTALWHVWAKEHRVVTAAHARLPDGAPRCSLCALQRPGHAMERQYHGE
jgi:hypothetical protein